MKLKVQTISQDFSASALVQFSQDMNTGNRRFNAALNNYFTRKHKSTDLEDGVQTYQLPPDCVRVSGVKCLDSASREYPLAQIRSEYQWTELNSTDQSGDQIIYFFVQGSDEIALYPTPSEDVTNGLIIYYEPRGRDLSQADYTTGTITLTDGSVTVTGAGTAFSLSMVGRVLRDTDGSSGYDYRIGSYNSGTEILLEEPFTGVSGSGKTYLIGESPDYPSEYHEAPVDYALARYFEMMNNPVRAKYHDEKFKDMVSECKERYASSSSSMVITDESFGYDWLQDNTFSVTETN